MNTRTHTHTHVVLTNAQVEHAEAERMLVEARNKLESTQRTYRAAIDELRDRCDKAESDLACMAQEKASMAQGECPVRACVCRVCGRYSCSARD